MYYPMMIELKDKVVVVIGGGKIAYRKVCSILSFGAQITVVSPFFVADFESIKAKVQLITNRYKEEYMHNAFMMIVATDDEMLNKQIGLHCKEHALLCNVTSHPELSSFIMPSVMRRGELVLSVSTCGNSPSLARKIKKELESRFDTSYERYVQLLGEIRQIILAMHLEEEVKVKTLNKLVDLNLKELEAYGAKLRANDHFFEKDSI